MFITEFLFYAILLGGITTIWLGVFVATACVAADIFIAKRFGLFKRKPMFVRLLLTSTFVDFLIIWLGLVIVFVQKDIRLIRIWHIVSWQLLYLAAAMFSGGFGGGRVLWFGCMILQKHLKTEKECQAES